MYGSIEIVKGNRFHKKADNFSDDIMSSAVGLDGTPRPIKKRTGWSVLVFQKGITYQCRLFIRRQNGGKGLYSSAESASKNRPAWPPVIACDYNRQSNNVSFTNIDNENKNFSVVTLDPNVYGFDEFTQEVADLISQNNLGLLIMYFDTLGRSKDFCGHSSKYDEFGIPLESRQTMMLNIQNAGGSLTDLKKFHRLARECAFKLGIEPQGSDLRLSSINKRKITDHFNVDSRKKLSKTERIESNYKEALEEQHGLEKSLVNSYVSDSVSLELAKLSVSDKLYLPLNRSKVREIKDSMEDQFDPILATLYVIPKDLKRYEGGEDLETLEFEVVCGQHKFHAMKEIIHEGKGDKLIGVAKGKLPCYICKTGSPSVVNHANIRNNDIVNKFSQPVGTEDLLFVYHGLATKSSHESNDAVDTVKTLCLYRKTSPEDTAALLKIIGWPITQLEKLIEVLDKYKRYKTLDAKGGYGNRANLSKRQSKILSKADFRMLGSCSPSYFDEHSQKVIDMDLSLRDLLLKSKDHNEMLRTMSSASKLAGYEDIETLRSKYPEKFNESALNRFKGAEVFGKKKNEQGIMLSKYVKNVKDGKSFKSPVMVNEISCLFDVTSENLDNNDVIVYYCSKDLRNDDFIRFLIDYAGCSTKDHLAVLMVLADGSQIFDVVSQFLNWKDKAEFKVVQLCFEKISNARARGVSENLTFGILFGKLYYYGDQLYSLQHGPVETELCNVVKKICCPGAKIAYISGAGSEVLKIHNTSADKTAVEGCIINYYAPKVEMDKFIKKYLVNVPVREPSVLSMNNYGCANANIDVDEENNHEIDEAFTNSIGGEESGDPEISRDEISESFNASMMENDGEISFNISQRASDFVDTAALAATIL